MEREDRRKAQRERNPMRNSGAWTWTWEHAQYGTVKKPYRARVVCKHAKHRRAGVDGHEQSTYSEGKGDEEQPTAAKGDERQRGRRGRKALLGATERRTAEWRRRKLAATGGRKGDKARKDSNVEVKAARLDRNEKGDEARRVIKATKPDE